MPASGAVPVSQSAAFGVGVAWSSARRSRRRRPCRAAALFTVDQVAARKVYLYASGGVAWRSVDIRRHRPLLSTGRILRGVFFLIARAAAASYASIAAFSNAPFAFHSLLILNLFTHTTAISHYGLQSLLLLEPQGWLCYRWHMEFGKCQASSSFAKHTNTFPYKRTKDSSTAQFS